MNNCSFCYDGIYELFISKSGKRIWMCPSCGCIELLPETKNKRVVSYQCNNTYKFTPIIDKATYKQASYLMALSKQLDIDIDISSLTKDEARCLISELVEKVKSIT